ncbi:MAG: ABC transporter permease [Methanobacteriota archaeon]
MGRTFEGAFLSSFRNQLRFYTFRGWMISSLLSPLFLLASAAVVAGIVASGTVPARFFALTGYPDYLAFVVLGLATHGLVLSALDDGAVAVYDEEQEGTWDLLSLTPMNRFVWMYAKTAAGMVSSFVDFAIVLFAGALVVDFPLHPASLLVALAGLVAAMVALQGVGFLMAAAGLYWKQPYALAMLVNPVLVFISGMLFPVEALPGWVQRVAAIFPLTHGLKILRDAILLDRGFGELVPVFVRLAATGALFMTVGFFAFRAMEGAARRKGVMGRY